MTTDSDSNGRENQPRRAGRPSKLTPALKEEILTAIGKGGCTYVDACLEAGISTSTFQLWKQKGQEQKTGRFSEFSAHLKKAEAEFRAHYLKKIRQAVDESSVETRKTVWTIGDGDDQGGRSRRSSKLRDRRRGPRPPGCSSASPEQYSRKHLDVTARVTNTEPPPVMHLVVVDPVKQREDAEADAPLTRLSTY